VSVRNKANLSNIEEWSVVKNKLKYAYANYRTVSTIWNKDTSKIKSAFSTVLRLRDELQRLDTELVQESVYEFQWTLDYSSQECGGEEQEYQESSGVYDFDTTFIVGGLV